MKTDNANPGAKLALRRHFLRAYHADGSADVLDCCQATGRLWKVLRSEFSIRSYWGVDIVKKRGRVKVDSARILGQHGWQQNVIDVDTYGMPWPHWLALLDHGPEQMTVFLTIGNLKLRGATSLSSHMREVLNVQDLDMPKGLNHGLQDLATRGLLAKCLDRFEVVEAREASPGRNARYIGIRLREHGLR